MSFVSVPAVITVLSTCLDHDGRVEAITRLRGLAEKETDKIDAKFYESSAKALEELDHDLAEAAA